MLPTRADMLAITAGCSLGVRRHDWLRLGLMRDSTEFNTQRWHAATGSVTAKLAHQCASLSVVTNSL